MTAYHVQPVSSLQATIRPPGSKRITNRALICAALAEGRSTLTGALAAEDTYVMLNALRQLGLSVDHDEAKAKISLVGSGGQLSVQEAELFVENSGTTIRFLTAMLAACRGRFRLDGIARMRERPIGDLLKALNQLGAKVSSEGGNDCPPVLIEAQGLQGGRAEISGDISSQYLSGLLMACPYAGHDTDLQVRGELVSQPYVPA